MLPDTCWVHKCNFSALIGGNFVGGNTSEYRVIFKYGAIEIVNKVMIIKNNHSLLYAIRKLMSCSFQPCHHIVYTERNPGS